MDSILQIRFYLILLEVLTFIMRRSFAYDKEHSQVAGRVEDIRGKLEDDIKRIERNREWDSSDAI